MGAVTNIQDEARQLAAVHAIDIEARRWIQHHLGNALAGAMGMLYLGRYDEAMQALDHAVMDLRQITPPADLARLAEINLEMMRQRGGR